VTASLASSVECRDRTVVDPRRQLQLGRRRLDITYANGDDHGGSATARLTLNVTALADKYTINGIHQQRPDSVHRSKVDYRRLKAMLR
jgi:hypothetical protein